MALTPHRLLVMDDEPQICSFIENVASRLGFEVTCLVDSIRFMETLKAFAPSAIITDLKMPGCDGVRLLQSMKDADCQAQVIVISGMDQRVLSTAEKLGRSHGLKMVGVLQKPVKLADLELLLRNAMSAQRCFSQEDLKAAIANAELVVHYQPKIARDNGTWSIDGAEALVRWQHPLYGLVLPGEFLALAEESDLIGALTDHVLETSVFQIASWMRRGLNFKVAVNLSARLITDLEFPDRLRQLLQEHDVPGSKLILELTESAAMADPSKAMDVFLRLRMSEIGLSIDDFGTGFSSLKQLYELPFDEVKIDRTFVQELPGDDEARAIVRATIDMAHALGMTACAEGVETRSALEYLESVNCDQAQGFLISRAVPATEFELLVGPWNAQTLRRATRQS
jgi:EAL domain-containing protein (putative c-di-GMP-specific phosphodiesterase class I)